MTPDRLRVLTLNIWNRQGAWERRLGLIRDGIRDLAPDVVGLQEVLRLAGSPDDQAAVIADGLGYHVAYGAAWPLGGGLDFGNAVLSRHPIVETESWTLPGREGVEARALLYALVDAPCGKVPFFVTHLAWRFHEGDLRLDQVRFIAARVAERATRDHWPAVLVGDFNAEPASDEIRYLRGHHVVGGESTYLCDAWGFFDEHDDKPGWTFARRNPHARLAHEPSRRLDYVFVRGPDRKFRGEPLRCEVVLDAPDADGNWPSDHFGVYAELAAGNP